jgi:hypothetical protein
MKTLRMTVLTIIVLAAATTSTAEVGRWGLGVGAKSGDIGFQLRKNFWLGGDVSQITGQGSVFLHNKTTFRVDADYHFVITEGKGRFYPLVGLDFAFTSDDAKFGVNGGGGVNFKLTEKNAAFGEVKYVFGGWDGWAFMGGIFF